MTVASTDVKPWLALYEIAEAAPTDGEKNTAVITEGPARNENKRLGRVNA